MKRFLCLICFAFLCIFSGFAAEVTMQVLQHGGNTENVSETALLLEDALLNSFFNAGHIVTNEPASMSYSDNDDKKFGQNLTTLSAMSGGDYVVQVIVFLQTEKSTSPESVRFVDIAKIEWIITRINSNMKKNGMQKGPSNFDLKNNSMRNYIASVASTIVKDL